jgi:hypothetical protein
MDNKRIKMRIKNTCLNSIFLFTLGLFTLSSCVDSDIDFSESWIKYTDEDSKSVSDTIYSSLNKTFNVLVWTQSNDGSKPQIYKQIDNNEVIDITNDSYLASLSGNTQESKEGYRQINRLRIDIYDGIYSTGQVIRYQTEIGSKTGNIKKELYIVVK